MRIFEVDMYPPAATGWRLLVSSGTLLFTGTLAWAILSLPADSPGLHGLVNSRLSESGVESPVTAVLLNFRAYDTFLEIVVLLVAIMGLRAIRLGSTQAIPSNTEVSPLLLEFVRFLTPIMILFSGYLLWAGSKYPGGAFQAGAVLGSAGILLLLAERLRIGDISPAVERGLLAVGAVVFGIAGLVCMAWGGMFLEYPAPAAKGFILVIEAAGAISVAATFAVLFAGRSLSEPNDAAIDDGPGGHP